MQTVLKVRICNASTCNVIIPDARHMVCSKCKLVSYCTKTCQVSSWPLHKIDCSKNNQKKMVDTWDEVLQQSVSEGMLYKTNFVECWSYDFTQAHVSYSDAVEAVQKGQHRHRGLCRNANGVFRRMPSFQKYLTERRVC